MTEFPSTAEIMFHRDVVRSIYVRDGRHGGTWEEDIIMLACAESIVLTIIATIDITISHYDIVQGMATSSPIHHMK